jgi:hypothetical protein
MKTQTSQSPLTDLSFLVLALCAAATILISAHTATMLKVPGFGSGDQLARTAAQIAMAGI